MSSPLKSASGIAGLAASGRYGKRDGGAGVTISERIGLGLATVAARKGQARSLQDRVREAYGVDLPQTSRVVVGRDVSFVGYGPGQWLAVSETLASEALARDLAERLKGLASISDQSSGRTVIRVSGTRARDVLAKGLPIDLDPRAFPLGSAATSTISLMGVQLWQADDTRSYDIAVFRSLSESFWRWLAASAAEFGYEVVAPD
ncbi:sarcosine oxidase subunit gamma [Methyloceanibacter sp.]|uniref:sarcosine oxidase subunit gamma n=1 Tax=Methyloceanibacter sp. TaxID=1965321 RepID=UPI002C84A24E|nr:sarcosine oxidase subunit gamma family protein [Methyloceanibacter sp.]